MCLPLLLWIDLKKPSSDCGIDSALSFAARVERCSGTSDIDAAIRKSSPDILCFEFDYPDAGDLGILQIEYTLSLRGRATDLDSRRGTDEARLNRETPAGWAPRGRGADVDVGPSADIAQHPCGPLGLSRW